jgi:hypothetical protein
MFALSPEGFRTRTALARPSASPQLSHLPATLTSHPQRPEKSATLSLAFATLTSRVKHKSCVCHSYKKHPGWGCTLQREMSSFPDLTTRHSPLATISFTMSTCEKHTCNPFRIRTYKKTGEGHAFQAKGFRFSSFHFRISLFLSLTTPHPLLTFHFCYPNLLFKGAPCSRCA